MANEIRGFENTEGIELPFYEISYTSAQVASHLAGGSYIYIYSSNPGAPASGLISNAAFLEVMRSIAQRNIGQGWNIPTRLNAAPSGSLRFLSGSSPYGPTISHTNGTATWQDEYNYEVLWVTGGPNSTWKLGTRQQMRPFPGPLQAPQGVGFPIQWVVVRCSDGVGRRIGFQPYANAWGWQALAVTNDNLPTGMGPNLSGYDSYKIDDLAIGGDEELARYNPRTKTNLIGNYILNKTDADEIFATLWNTSILDGFRNAFYGDGSDAILSFKWYFGLKDKIPVTGTARFSLGNVTFADVGKKSYSRSEYIEYDFGSVNVPAYYGSHLDWTATKYKAYLPFVGVIDLEPGDVVGKTLYLKYVINITDGSAVVQLSTSPTSSSGNTSGLIFTTSCSWAEDIPVRAVPNRDFVSAIGRVVPVPGLGGLSSDGGAYSVGELAPNSNVMGDFEAKIVAYRASDMATGSYSDAVGLPSAATVNVGSASGYLKATTIYNSGSLAMRRADEIVALLQEGIYI